MNIKILAILILTFAACTLFAAHAVQLATEDGVTLVADTGVQLTPDQIAKLNGSVDSLVPLIPAQYQAWAVRGIALIGLLAMAGRVVIGWRNNGIFGVFSGLFAGTNVPKDINAGAGLSSVAAAVRNELSGSGYPAKTGSTLKSPLMALALIATVTVLGSGCQGYQTINHQSGTGLQMTLPVGYNGNNVFQLQLTAGAFKNTQVLQPVSTNTLHSPGIVVASSDGGTIASSLNSTAGVGTNAAAVGTGSATVIGGDSDVVTTGDASMTMTNWSTVTTHGYEPGMWHGASRLTSTNNP